MAIPILMNGYIVIVAAIEIPTSYVSVPYSVCVRACHIQPNTQIFRKRWIDISLVVHVYINVEEEQHCCYIIIRVVLNDAKLSSGTRGEVGTKICSK
jgi:hypothetical protein